jgi:hypothetical protein
MLGTRLSVPHCFVFSGFAYEILLGETDVVYGRSIVDPLQSILNNIINVFS